MGWSEGNLFCLSVVVGWVAVQSNFTDWDKGIIRMWPHLGDVKYVKSVFGSILLRHCLHKPIPAWMVALRNLIVKIVSAPLRVLDALCCGLGSCEVLNALSSFVVILNVVDFILGINPSESVG